MSEQHFTSLECSGVVDITVSTIEGGVRLIGDEPFLCETEGSKIIVRSKPGMGNFNMNGITMTNGNISISNCSNNYNSFNVNGCSFTQINNTGRGKTQRIIIDGVDVTNEIKEVVEKKKGNTETKEESDGCKREYTLIGAVLLNEISVSDSSQCVIQDQVLLDKDSMDLEGSGSASLHLVPCKIDRLDISASGCSKISGDVTVRRLVVKSSGTASINKFHTTGSAKLNASGCASINISADTQATINKNKSGCANITVS